MPPNFHATTANLPTFTLPPHSITPSPANLALGRALVAAFRRDGIIQLAMTPTHRALWHTSLAASRSFFGRPHAEKAACVDARSYAGYIASGEEVTGGVADYSEVFTVTRDLGAGDARVRAGWPCHGPVPWPAGGMREAVGGYMAGLGVEGEKVVRLVEMGLGVESGALMRYTADGWHHMRVLR
jgi:isopenicillin N synthase-like dioxygenase